jgi:hypothetical protein
MYMSPIGTAALYSVFFTAWVQEKGRGMLKYQYKFRAHIPISAVSAGGSLVPWRLMGNPANGGSRSFFCHLEAITSAAGFATTSPIKAAKHPTDMTVSGPCPHGSYLTLILSSLL